MYRASTNVASIGTSAASKMPMPKPSVKCGKSRPNTDVAVGMTKQDSPTRIKQNIEMLIWPTRYAIEAKKLVPTKYPIESGMKTVPICHFFLF